MNYSVVRLSHHVYNLYAENYKALKKEIKNRNNTKEGICKLEDSI